MKFRLSSLFSLARSLMLANGICSSFCRDFCGEQLPLSVTSPRFEEVTQVVPSSAELSARGLGTSGNGDDRSIRHSLRVFADPIGSLSGMR
jgi:hypothetical protein